MRFIRGFCYGCGYNLNYPTTKLNGHRYHVSCAERKVEGDKKTKEILGRVAKLKGGDT